MKKQKSLNFILNLEIYPFDIIFSFNESDEQLKKQLAKKGVEWDDLLKLKGNGRYVMMPDNQSIVRLRYYPESPSDLGTLAHEIFHAVTYILDTIGMRLELNVSDEAYSYLIGWVTQKVFEKLLTKRKGS